MSRRFVLRFGGAGEKPRADVAKIRATRSLTVIDESPRMLLVDASEETLDRLMTALPEWTLSPEMSVPLPDPRPKVIKRF